MHIDEDQMFHGAALVQIAEYASFKAINRFEDLSARGAFRINTSTGIYLKHASNPTGRYHEYLFTFNKKNLSELEALKRLCTRLFVVMVCVKAREICCVEIADIENHIERRRKSLGRAESQYQILVTIPHDKSFRVYANVARKKGLSLKKQIVSRNGFPAILFEHDGSK
jgi:hypothetical protein